MGFFKFHEFVLRPTESDNTYKSVFTDIEPDYEDVFKIVISDILDDTDPKSFPDYFVYTKNAIYALNGYADADTVAPFWRKLWK